MPLHSALTLAAACSIARAALRQSCELRAAGLVTEPIHAETEGKPACASACWLAAFTARPTSSAHGAITDSDLLANRRRKARIEDQLAGALDMALGSLRGGADAARAGLPFAGVVTTQPDPRLVRFNARIEPTRLMLLAATTVHAPGRLAICPSYRVTGMPATPFTNS